MYSCELYHLPPVRHLIITCCEALHVHFPSLQHYLTQIKRIMTFSSMITGYNYHTGTQSCPLAFSCTTVGTLANCKSQFTSLMWICIMRCSCTCFKTFTVFCFNLFFYLLFFPPKSRKTENQPPRKRLSNLASSAILWLFAGSRIVISNLFFN